MQDQIPQKRLNIIVSGRVQGVGYRYFARDAARSFNITGWVKNCDNGNVEVEAQGKSEILDSFCAELKRGPQGGYVEKLDIRELPVKDGENSFKIMH